MNIERLKELRNTQGYLRLVNSGPGGVDYIDEVIYYIESLEKEVKAGTQLANAIAETLMFQSDIRAHDILLGAFATYRKQVE